MPRGDRHDDILHAAEKLFSQRRFHEVTLDEVAKAAQVGKGTIYRYFADKDDLFFQLVTHGFDELCDLLQRRVPGAAPFEQRLLGACQEIVRFFDRRRQLFRLMQNEDARLAWCQGSLRDRWHAHRQHLVSAVAAILEQGITEGVLRRDLPPDVLAQFLLGMLRTRARDLAQAPAELQRIEVVVELFCRGAHAASPAPHGAQLQEQV